ncbi:stress-induced-phospho protein 1 [Phakopsora pachyrhizi]|uniref:Stress-induced-phospho protein 1 n=2 Tax=Phakopsora pachyrhizi TaxID=170000 RepID=A0AAV0BEF2_PHAPC|nr:stress-induced-phospho protein 1 [Phakopsora pachyrhizi]
MSLQDVDPETRAKAETEKADGNNLYRSRDFDGAISAYKRAFSLNPDPIYLNNLAACYFEKGDYDECIKQCERAVEEGRERRVDYKTIAKSFARMGSAYLKTSNYELAIKNLERSLTEHRTPETLAKLKEAEKIKAEEERKAYINPELSDKSREEGNTCFKNGDFATAVKHYTESIKRNPSDPRAYTNRAASYSKLLALPEALKDTDLAIEADPNFTKAYIRKALTLLAMKDYKKAVDALRKAEEHDPEKKHAKEIATHLQKCVMAEYGERANETDEQRLERAMRDPEIQQIMSDPVMQQILSQGQQDPKALQSHMSNPMIREKIIKLIEAGIIKTR